MKLIRLGTDRDLLANIEDEEDDFDYEATWAPMHAWRALVQMQAMEAVAPLAQVFDWSEDTEGDLINEGLTDAFEKFGAPVIEPLAAFMNEAGHSVPGYISASEVLARIGVEHPEHRERIAQIVTSALEEHFERNEKEVNGFWISDLIDLDAVSSHPVIEKAFEAKKVDLTIAGDLEDVEMELGLREERETPAPNLPLPFNFMRSLREVDESLPALVKGEMKRFEKKAKKEKNKRKQEKKSRKKNRKKK